MNFISTTFFSTTIKIISLFFINQYSISHAQPIIKSYELFEGSGKQILIDNPMETVKGDLLIMTITHKEGKNHKINPPIGWNSLIYINNGEKHCINSFYKVSTGKEPKQHILLLPKKLKWGAEIIRIIGSNPHNPIGYIGKEIGSDENLVAPSIRTYKKKQLILCYFSSTSNYEYSEVEGTENLFSHFSKGKYNSLYWFSQSITNLTQDKTTITQQPGKWIGMQIGINSIPSLPVELTNFEANFCGNSLVRLSWKSKTNTPKTYFRIDQSTDRVNWKKIHSTPLKHKGTENNFYSHTLKLSGSDKYYFRIVAINFNNSNKLGEVDVSAQKNRSVLGYVKVTTTPLSEHAN